MKANPEKTDLWSFAAAVGGMAAVLGWDLPIEGGHIFCPTCRVMLKAGLNPLDEDDCEEYEQNDSLPAPPQFDSGTEFPLSKGAKATLISQTEIELS
jgi:hypothetical protein